MSTSFVLLLLVVQATTWQHPAGMITDATIADVRTKIDTQEWARALYDARRENAQAWTDLSEQELRRIFPRIGGNVYHNFSCPTDRVSLTFDPFNPDAFTCPTCQQTFAPDTDAGIYEPDDRYHGNMYAGWICLFHLTTTQRMVEMALIGRLEDDTRMLDRATLLLLLYTEVLRQLPVREAPGISSDAPTYRQYRRIFTYHREGDNKILADLAQTYELLRDRLSPDQRTTVETHTLQRMLDDIMLEPIYVYDHNNVYQWHRTIVQTALALEREDLIDWSFGFGAYSREHLPEHRSMDRILATHFNADGAFWELCSGYHLYPLNHLCEFAVLSHNLSKMDPERFPPGQYDLTRRESDGGRVIHDALAWFISMAMPDRTMTIIGDSTKARSGMETYTATAEIGYRYYDIQAVGDYPRYRDGNRSWDGLLFGAAEIQQHPTAFDSDFLSSGWVSLRSEWRGNRVWTGLNALIKGGSHQHADRLSLALFSQGELLALEKSVPYNEATLRVLGTQTPAHNTVTVDFTSQPQGEDLTDVQTPQVVYFHAGPVVQYTELHGDALYANVRVYRRSVAVIEDIVVDLFRVEGGTTHDWIVNHGGTAPVLSMETSAGPFEPRRWLEGGSDRIRTATSDDRWTAQWQVNEVTSRLTMVGAPSTEVFALETYPLDNAVITDAYPPTQTLCVRRTAHAPFLAVWDAWKVQPNLRKVEPATDRTDALTLTTDAHQYHLMFGPGAVTFSDGTRIDTDGAFTLLRDRDALTMVHGTRLTVERGELRGTIGLNAPATMTATWADGTARMVFSGDIAHDTVGGVAQLRPMPAVEHTVTGSWFGGSPPAQSVEVP